MGLELKNNRINDCPQSTWPMRICDGYLMSLDNTPGTSDRRSSIDEHQNPFATENVRNPKKEHESDNEVKVLVYKYRSLFVQHKELAFNTKYHGIPVHLWERRY